MSLDPAVLARIQFATNMTCHILFPSITIAMAWILLFFKLRYKATRDMKWMQAYFFWTKIFALCFALGIVTGVTMSFQFGTNWPGYMTKVGNIAGPLLAYEVLTAFFMEATFLGIMLFGFRRVPAWLHTLASFLVALGTTASAFWILALNSWMQTPVGFEMRNGVAYPTDWLQILFNPSFPYRFTHMLLASGLTASFLIAGISAYRWLRNDRTPAVMAMLRTGVGLASILIPLQMFVGDQHGLNTLHHQPQKIAAMEAVWNTEKSVPLVAFAIPNEKTHHNDMSIEVPHGASLILTHSYDGAIRGLNEFEPNHPPVAPLFFAFRIMVGVAGCMLLVGWGSALQLYRKHTLNPFWARALVAMTFAGWIATVSGWYVTEIGRQPWLVTGILKTVDAISTVPAPMISVSLTVYLFTYIGLLVAFVSTIFYMARKAGELPADAIPSMASGQAVVDAVSHGKGE